MCGRSRLAKCSGPFAPFQSLCEGVGHILSCCDNEQPFSPVRRSKRSSRYDERPDDVSFILQTGAYGIEREIDRSTNIFSKDPTGPYFPDHPEHFVPEPGTFAFKSGLLAGAGQILTGKSAVNNVNCSCESGSRQRSDVVADGNMRPPLSQNLHGVRLNFAEQNRLDSGGFGGSIQTSDTREKRYAYHGSNGLRPSPDGTGLDAVCFAFHSCHALHRRIGVVYAT